MKKMNEIEKIRELISKDELSSAFLLLKELVKNHQIIDAVLVREGNLTELEREIIQGTVSLQDAMRIKSEIRAAMLKVLRSIENIANTNEDVKTIFRQISIGNSFNFSTNINEWIKTKRGLKIVLFISLLVIVKFLIAAIGFPLKIDTNYLRAFGLIIQILFLGFACLNARQFKDFKFETSNQDIFSDEKDFWSNLRLHRRTEPNPVTDEEKKYYWDRFKVLANKSINQFVYFWFFFWLFLFILCLVGLIHRYCLIDGELTTAASTTFGFVEDLFNNLNNLMLLYLYLNITISTSKISEATWIIFAVIVGIVSFLEPALFFNIENESTTNIIKFWIQLGISLISGLTLIAFLGRLSGKFMNIPLYLMMFLYSYVLYQLLYPFVYCKSITLYFPDSPTGTTLFLDTFHVIMSLFSIIFISALYVVITWLLDSGKMLYFISEESSINFKQNDDFNKFLLSVPMKENKIF